MKVRSTWRWEAANDLQVEKCANIVAHYRTEDETSAAGNVLSIDHYHPKYTTHKFVSKFIFKKQIEQIEKSDKYRYQALFNPRLSEQVLKLKAAQKQT